MIKRKKIRKPYVPPPQEPPLEGLDSLLASGANPQSAGWNGMKVYVEDDAGHVLINRGGDAPHDAASLTKLMSFYVTLKAVRDGKVNFDDTVRITAADVTGGDRAHNGVVHIRSGEKLTVRQLLGAMMTASDNGVAVALSRTVEQATGKNFLGEMQQSARELHLGNTHLYNVDGMPIPNGKDNETTAHDMVKLMRQLDTEFHDWSGEYLGRSGISYGAYSTEAHHFLNLSSSPLKLPEEHHAIGKTGWYTAAGHNIAAIITSPGSLPAAIPVAIPGPLPPSFTVLPQAPVAHGQLFVSVLGVNAYSPERARQFGVPEEMVQSEIHGSPRNYPHVRGNVVRDTVVRQLSAILQDGVMPSQAVAMSTALQAPVKPAQEKPPQQLVHAPRHHTVHLKHKKRLAEAAEPPPLPLSPGHQALLSQASAQYQQAIETCGTPSAPVGKSGAQRLLN